VGCGHEYVIALQVFVNCIAYCPSRDCQVVATADSCWILNLIVATNFNFIDKEVAVYSAI
jgi:hypothetical protein